MKTKRVTLYTQLFPGWQNSMFAPSLHSMPPGDFPGCTPVAVEVDLPLIETEFTVDGRVVAMPAVESIQRPA